MSDKHERVWQIRSDGEMGNAHDISLLVVEHGLHPLGMDDDRLLDPPYSWHDRAHLTHLTTIVGHVLLLRRWVTRTGSLDGIRARERAPSHQGYRTGQLGLAPGAPDAISTT